MHDNAIKKKGVETVKTAGRVYMGYVQVNEEVIKPEKEFLYWLQLAPDYNNVAKSSKKSSL